MTVICPHCNTENRDVAKFCIECVSALPTAFIGLHDAPTERMPFRATASGRLRLADHHAGQGGGRGARGGWIGGWTRAALLGAVLVGGAALAWWLTRDEIPAASPPAAAASAGDGGLPVHAASAPQPGASSGKVSPLEAAGIGEAEAATLSPPLSEGAVAGDAKAAMAGGSNQPPRAGDAAAGAAPDAAASAAGVNRPSDARGPGPRAAAAERKGRNARANPPAPEPEPARPPAPAVAALDPPPAPETRPADPATACAGKNFVLKARCMAAQCQQAAFSAHPQCDAVRRQQQLDEQRRNPLLAN